MLRKVRILTGVVLALSLAGASFAAEEKTVAIEAGDLKLNVPESWKKAERTNQFRLAQFAVPARKGEKETDAELVVFHFGAEGGGGVADNIERWKKQFDAEGREIKVTQGESEQGKYVFVELKGTFNKSVGPPILMKTEKIANARGLFVILSSKNSGNYFIRLTGSDGLVASQSDAFRKSFGGDAAKESEYKAK